MYNFVPSLVDEDVLILPGAASTPVDDGIYFFNIGSWLVNLPTMVSLSDWKASFHCISFFSVWLFPFFSGSFQAVYTKSMYSGPTTSCVNHMEHWSVICHKHAFMPCWIVAQYLARVLHFSASSFYSFFKLNFAAFFWGGGKRKGGQGGVAKITRTHFTLIRAQSVP